jgi:hypothetical protein
MLKTVWQIRAAGFEWPLEDAVNAHVASFLGIVNLTATLDNLEAARAPYAQESTDAYKFKQTVGALDYSDFTDGAYASQLADVDVAIDQVKRIIRGFGGRA